MGLLVASVIAVLLVLLFSYLCFRFCFYVKEENKLPSTDIVLPEGKVYEPFYDDMTGWILAARDMPHEDVHILSRDGLRLTGKFYEFASGAPIEIMFHGYRGSAERDMSGGVQRCFQVGHSALVVEQRCSRTSEGNVITFGIKEHLDCLDWIDFVIAHYGADVRIILTGISMGASTVLMAAGKALPPNVIGVLADCGFNSAKDVMYHVMKSLKLPPRVIYPLVKLGAKMFGGFDLDADSAEEAVKHCRVPVIFFHGAADDFVPSWMSQVNYDACASRKQLVIIEGAGHGLSYPVAPKLYIDAVRDFFGADISDGSASVN